MEIKNLINQYNEQRNRSCKTLEDILKDVVEDALQAIDDDLIELIDDIGTGKYSNEDVIERLQEVREKLI